MRENKINPINKLEKKNRIFLPIIVFLLYLLLFLASIFVFKMAHYSATIPPKLRCLKTPWAFPHCKKDIAASFVLTLILVVFLSSSFFHFRRKKIKGYFFLAILFVSVFIWSFALFSLDITPRTVYNTEIKSELSQIRTAAEMYYIDNATYFGFTIPEDLVSPKCSSYIIQISPDGKDYLAYAKLCYKEKTFWCLDSEGFAGEIVADSIPNNIYLCP